jgi:hypothetical protein
MVRYWIVLAVLAIVLSGCIIISGCVVINTEEHMAARGTADAAPAALP